MITVFGIRHHGPGSANNLRQALHHLQPDLLLIEGPADAEGLLTYVADPDLRPPVALLLYNPKNLSQAAHYPFAEFSPEWQALRYGVEQRVPVRFMDLPQGTHFALDAAAAEEQQVAMEFEPQLPQAEQQKRQIIRDPIGYMARLAGYTDSERWWEVYFEQREGTEVFPLLIEMIGLLREELETELPLRERRREAFMRKTIRKAIKDGFENIAVICGAWHSPALHNIAQYKSSTDNALLKGTRKISIKGTWIPWTYDRLSTRSGYRAGVISPAYYRLLFHQRDQMVVRWMSEVARLLRKEDLDASSAHIIEAVRMADTLAAMRHLPLPGLEEMKEAAVAIFCEGQNSRLELIEEKLVVGDVMGQVPPSIPRIPLQQDLEQCIKSARLSKEYKATGVVDKELDLRKPSHLLASHLLHRLNLLAIPWGWEKKVRRYSQAAGNFHENWKLKWKPDFVIQLIEAGMLGNTVYEAAVNRSRRQAEEQERLPELTQLLEQALKADLKALVPFLVEHLRSRSALTRDVHHLMQGLPALVDALRYGSTRQMDVEALLQVITEMVPRICIALPGACIGVDEEEARKLFEQIQLTHQAISRLNIDDFTNQWVGVLGQIAGMQSIHGLLGGTCTRVLFDREVVDVERTSTRMRYALSQGNDAFQAAYWIEGFLYGSGLLLILNPTLWNILDEWIDELPEAMFTELLPLLRRTFSGFSSPERRKMLALAERGAVEEKEQELVAAVDAKRAARVLPTLKLLLGIEE
ncbi:MAG: DUF5682 family protein [Bacteroidota bacterium]